MGTVVKRTAPRSPWQNGVAERFVGTVRRELTDHVIALNERHLTRLLREYLEYYHDDRSHFTLMKDTPNSRAVARKPRAEAKVQSESRTF